MEQVQAVEKLMPYRCPVCAKVPEHYYGRLGRSDIPMFCPNTPHLVDGTAIDPVQLVPVAKGETP